jgi:hypothetical protein
MRLRTAGNHDHLEEVFPNFLNNCICFFLSSIFFLRLWYDDVGEAWKSWVRFILETSTILSFLMNCDVVMIIGVQGFRAMTDEIKFILDRIEGLTRGLPVPYTFYSNFLFFNSYSCTRTPQTPVSYFRCTGCVCRLKNSWSWFQIFKYECYWGFYFHCVCFGSNPGTFRTYPFSRVWLFWGPVLKSNTIS